ncbi:MAG TPA: hypothetical protein DCE44_00860, partial [Verrucomicrobiales bacterium]|nr:hypothetical protein [Verrucomicrobiales bacterium]
MKVIVLLWGLFGCLVTTLGATYFVDFEGGSDANAGTSESLAWKHCPGDSKAAETPSRTSLGPGDTVRFKGGVVYLGQIALTASGATNNVITFDGNQPETWGTGRAVLDGDYRPGVILDGKANVSHLTIRGFEIRNVAGYRDDDPVLTKKCADFADPKGRAGLFAREGIAISFERGGNTNLRFEDL